MSVSLREVLGAARARSALLASEVSGYLALAVAEQSASSQRRVTLRDVELRSDGSVRIGGGSVTDATTAEASVRRLFGELLIESSSVSGTMLRISRRRQPAGLDALVREIEASLIPVNRGAGRRALARLHRDTQRAREAGELDFSDDEDEAPAIAANHDGAPVGENSSTEAAPRPSSSPATSVVTLDDAPRRVPPPVVASNVVPVQSVDDGHHDAARDQFAQWVVMADASTDAGPVDESIDALCSASPLPTAADDSVDADDVTTCARQAAVADVDEFVEVVFSPTPSPVVETAAAYDVPDLEIATPSGAEGPAPEPHTAPETVVALRELGLDGFGGGSWAPVAPAEPVVTQAGNGEELVEYDSLASTDLTPIVPLVQPTLWADGPGATPTLFHVADDATERAPTVIEASPEPATVEEIPAPAQLTESLESAIALGIAAEGPGPTNAVESVEPTIAVESVGPTNAVESVEPTIAVESVEPTNAVESVEPTIAVESVEPARETDLEPVAESSPATVSFGTSAEAAHRVEFVTAEGAFELVANDDVGELGGDLGASEPAVDEAFEFLEDEDDALEFAADEDELEDAVEPSEDHPVFELVTAEGAFDLSEDALGNLVALGQAANEPAPARDCVAASAQAVCALPSTAPSQPELGASGGEDAGDADAFFAWEQDDVDRAALAWEETPEPQGSFSWDDDWAQSALSSWDGLAVVDEEDEEERFRFEGTLQRLPTPLPPMVEPAVSQVVARRSDVSELLSSFRVEDIAEDEDLCRSLKELAGVDATGMPPAVDLTPPPVAVESCDVSEARVRAPGSPRPLVGALALLVAVGVAGSSALPTTGAPTLVAGAGAPRARVSELSTTLVERAGCRAEVRLREVPSDAEIVAHGGPERIRIPAQRSPEGEARLADLPCGEALEVTVKSSRSKRWLTIPVSASRLTPPAGGRRVRVTLLAR
ncbi:MAG: hypothetical protein R3B13_23725 [Polyangiaceae bacterium]